MACVFTCLPCWMKNHNLTAQELRDALEPLVPIIISKQLVNNLVLELAEYQVEVETYARKPKIQDEIEHVHKFWQVKRPRLKSWREFAHQCMLLQPSTAAVERAFSLLKLILSKPNMMHDLIQITLMLQYNRRESKQELNEEEHNDDSSESTMRRLLLEDLTI